MGEPLNSWCMGRMKSTPEDTETAPLAAAYAEKIHAFEDYHVSRPRSRRRQQDSEVHMVHMVVDSMDNMSMEHTLEAPYLESQTAEANEG